MDKPTPRLPNLEETIALNSQQPSRTSEEAEAQAVRLRQARMKRESLSEEQIKHPWSNGPGTQASS
ncbi:MAG: hypothetical protein JNJ83_24295 [Verrucomicrobiaceae bacterium]|nr:hypothetical protein [Verrucomicrobiaceae bacterium]